MLTAIGDARHTVVLAAHPDDEVIGAGSLLRDLRGLVVAHVTDGSPLNLTDAIANGLGTREEYAQARRRELRAALEVAGASEAALREFRLPDQGASLHLSELALQVKALLGNVDLVLTHPYEGGHPDHDACAFAAHAAVAILSRESGPRVPTIVEFTSYHAGPNGMATGEFLSGEPDWIRRLTPDERDRKHKMLLCFATQARMLQYFPVQDECFRIAPRYDFTRPPHPGTLFYERFDWGMTGARFCELARQALNELGLEGPL